MIPYLPDIYPDELIYSWLCRYYVHTGCITHKMALQHIYKKRSDNPSKEFLGNLSEEAREKVGELYSLEQLVIEHTMFPEYARFISLEHKKIAIQKMVEGNCDIHLPFSAVPRNSTDYYLKYCPECVAEDRKQYGETYWHRVAQIRGINTCTKHGRCLIGSTVPVKAEQTFTFCPAEEYVEALVSPTVNNDKLLPLERYIIDVFSAPIDLAISNDIPPSTVLFAAMNKTPYLASTGKMRNTQKLTEDMTKYYLESDIPEIPSITQIQRVLLGYSCSFSAICKIAFFLGMTVQQLLSPAITPEEICAEQKTHYNKNSVHHDWRTMDENLAPLLEKAAAAIYAGQANKNGRPEKASENSICRELGINSYQLKMLPRCNAILSSYSESYEDSWARKLVWAYQHLCKEKPAEAIYWSDLRRLTGVKKENIPNIILHLHKYSDKETEEALRKILIK